MPEITVTGDCDGWRIDRFLRKHLPGMPLSHIFKLFRTGKVRIDGKKAVANQRVKETQIVLIHIPDERFKEDAKSDKSENYGRVIAPFELEIIYEDADLIAINKPAGVPVHPGSGYKGGTCVDRIREYLGAQNRPGEFSPSLVHRIDLDTSGVLLAAKTYAALRIVAKAFNMRRVEKYYTALSVGRLPSKSGVIELPVKRLDHPERDREEQEGVTEYRVIQEKRIDCGTMKSVPFSLLELRLHTGRTHQIRSHLKDIDAPVVGDHLYGDATVNAVVRDATGLRRQFLHSARLVLSHPTSGETLKLEAPLPEDLKAVIRWAGMMQSAVEIKATKD